MPSRDPLAVWLYGTPIATLSENSSGKIELAWTPESYDRWGSGSRVMSHLLPLSAPGSGPHPARVTVFIDGLLPEGHARTNLAIDAGIRPEDSYALIRRYGRDTAGALVFQAVDEPEPVRVGSYRPIETQEIAQRLREAHHHTPTSHTGERDSSALAGMQPKITLHRDDIAGWQACLDGAPSTWILKLAQPPGSVSADVIDTEVLSLDITRHTGLAAAHAEIHTFDDIRAIAVRRYDRHQTSAGWTRVHQEDLAQALGLNTDDPLRKFQRGNTMPSLAHAARVLRDGGSEPDDLLRLTTVNYLLGNIDAHAKNISFFRHDDGRATLAPAYDIAMHLHHVGGDPQRTALDINHKINYADITITDVIAEGQTWGLPPRRASRVVHTAVTATLDALNALDPHDYPGVSEQAWTIVRDRAIAASRATENTSTSSGQKTRP